MIVIDITSLAVNFNDGSSPTNGNSGERFDAASAETERQLMRANYNC